VLSMLLGLEIVVVDAAVEGSFSAVGHRDQLLVVVQAEGAVRTAAKVLLPIHIVVVWTTL